MSLADRLLLLAKELASRAETSQDEAVIRRAVSTGYYALFHLLVIDACTRLSHGDLRLEIELASSFHHTHMHKVCSSIANHNPVKFLLASIPKPIPKDLVFVASTFYRAQEERHRADYKFHEIYDPITATTQVAQIDLAFAAWGRIRTEEYARVFLLGLQSLKIHE
jgi:hypothetical protein